MNETLYTLRPVSALYKVLPEAEPMSEQNGKMFLNESYDFQIAYKSDTVFLGGQITAHGGLAEQIEIREELLSAVTFEPEDADDYYLKSKLIPDALTEPRVCGLAAQPGTWRAVWVTVVLPKGFAAGTYRTEFAWKDATGKVLAETSYTIEVLPAVLPETDLRLTNWIHYDCIAEKHGVHLFDDDFYKIFGEYLNAYVDIGFNMLYVPLFTPPLDTAVGAERLTAQLVGVRKENGKYIFDFSALERFVRFAQSHGIRYFEFGHLFTQWGGLATPKIVAEENGENRRIFGWDVSSEDIGYETFLNVFLPEFMQKIDALGIRDVSAMHLTDEPGSGAVTRYAKFRTTVKKHIGDLPVMDALSCYDYCKDGLVDIPVVVLNVYEFVKCGGKGVFAYNCCLPANSYYSNRFINLPAERTRVLGIQLFEREAKGYLHWGFNFYNSYLSKVAVDPYRETDAAGVYPCGDGFIVYPDTDRVNRSVRSELIKAGFNDYRALLLLSEYAGREEVRKMLQRHGYKSFTEYPRDPTSLLNLRNDVYDEIMRRAERKRDLPRNT